ncbi:hypothetical protein EBS43_04845 [bacterium]|nr:hypothetical protein [bacterium]
MIRTREEKTAHSSSSGIRSRRLRSSIIFIEVSRTRIIFFQSSLSIPLDTQRETSNRPHLSNH